MRAHGVLTGTQGALAAYSRVLAAYSRVLTAYSPGPHAQVLEQYYASLQRLGAQLDAALLKRREAERLLAAEAMPRESVCVCAHVCMCVRA